MWNILTSFDIDRRSTAKFLWAAQTKKGTAYKPCASIDVPITKPKDFCRDVESIFGAGPAKWRCALCTATLTHEAAVHTGHTLAGLTVLWCVCVFLWVKITEDHDDNNNKDGDGDEDRTDDI